MAFSIFNAAFYGVVFLALLAFTKFDPLDGLLVLACMAASQFCVSLWAE